MDSILDLQNSFTEWIREEMAGFQSLNTHGELVNLNVYSQALPVQEGMDKQPVPYILNILSDATVEKEGIKARFHLLLGIYNNDLKNQGHQEIVNIIEKLYQNLYSQGIIAQKYRAEYPMEMEMQVKEDRYPFYYGLMMVCFTGVNTVEEVTFDWV